MLGLVIQSEEGRKESVSHLPFSTDLCVVSLCKETRDRLLTFVGSFVQDKVKSHKLVNRHNYLYQCLYCTFVCYLLLIRTVYRLIVREILYCCLQGRHAQIHRLRDKCTLHIEEIRVREYCLLYPQRILTFKLAFVEFKQAA